MTPFFILLWRETLLNWQQGGAGWLVVAFYVMTVVLFPFALGSKAETLSLVAPGVVWVAALLAGILTLDRMFSLDFEDGSMDLLILSGMPLWQMTLGKALAHWLNTLAPVILTTPLMALFLNLDDQGFESLIWAMLLGTPAFSFFGGIAGALTATIKRGGVLIPLLVLPLYIPTLIFGTTAVAEAIAGTGGDSSNLYFLAGISTFSILLGPLAASAAIKVTMD